MKKCPKCFAEMPDESKFCTNCGEPLPSEQVSTPTVELSDNSIEPVRGKWSLCKLIIGIVSIILFIIISIQSCAAGLSNALTDNGESSGTFGLFTAILYATAGVVGIVTRNSVKKASSIACTVMYWICFFFSRVGAGSYGDLKFWGILAFAFGGVYLFSICKSKKSYFICTVISVAYLILGLI